MNQEWAINIIIISIVATDCGHYLGFTHLPSNTRLSGDRSFPKSYDLNPSQAKQYHQSLIGLLIGVLQLITRRPVRYA